jgi:very-short-patch-repair endonuclease
VTAPARALVDLAASAPDHEIERAIAEARVQNLVTDRELEQALERAPVRTGAAKLRALASTDASRLWTRTEIERQLLRLLARAGLPTPETNARINGHEVDFLWRAQRLIVETDGYGAHGHQGAFERDRRRDQTHVASGYRVIRVTWRQLQREPLTVIASIAQALAAVPARST